MRRKLECPFCFENRRVKALDFQLVEVSKLVKVHFHCDACYTTTTLLVYYKFGGKVTRDDVKFEKRTDGFYIVIKERQKKPAKKEEVKRTDKVKDFIKKAIGIGESSNSEKEVLKRFLVNNYHNITHNDPVLYKDVYNSYEQHIGKKITGKRFTQLLNKINFETFKGTGNKTYIRKKYQF